MKVEKAPRCYLKKNHRLCTQLFELSRLLFSNCLLSSAKIAIHNISSASKIYQICNLEHMAIVAEDSKHLLNKRRDISNRRFFFK